MLFDYSLLCQLTWAVPHHHQMRARLTGGGGRGGERENLLYKVERHMHEYTHVWLHAIHSAVMSCAWQHVYLSKKENDAFLRATTRIYTHLYIGGGHSVQASWMSAGFFENGRVSVLLLQKNPFERGLFWKRALHMRWLRLVGSLKR